jgi:hypothetical protein
MTTYSWLLGLLLLGYDGNRDGGPPTDAADRITLRDGKVVRGLVTGMTPGPRGSVEFLVRRAWAEGKLKDHLGRWDRSTAATARQAVAQRQKRLEAWRKERAAGVPADDRIVSWIDQELKRLSANEEQQPSILIGVHASRNDVRGVERRPVDAERLLGLAWLCNLPDPESMPLKELKDALESRGYVVDAAPGAQMPSLNGLLPPTVEPESTWLGRRAATELAVDPDLRFLRFQDTVMLEPGPGQPLGALGLSSAISELKRLLDPDQGQKVDPLTEKLNAVAARGRIGAVVTRLEIQPDLSGVVVESSLWVCSGGRWTAFGSRAATVRTDDLGNDAGKGIEADPQVQGVFGLVESLGLGEIPAEVKTRSVRIGAATQKALGMARAAFSQDLQSLALPLLEPENRRPADPGQRPANPARDQPAPQ